MLPKDPFMLYSAVNMKLRDSYSSLDDLCAGEGIDRNTLLTTLSASGFEYLPDINQFR